MSLCLLGFGGCREPVAPPSLPKAEAGLRERQALELLQRARAAGMPEKIDLLRRVVAVYDDLPLSSDAHFELVFYLRLDERDLSRRPALAEAKVFAGRKPTDPRVTECFKLIAQDLLDGPDAALRQDAFAAWLQWIADREARRDMAATTVADAKAQALVLDRRWKDAESAVVGALKSRSDGSKGRTESLVLLGDLRGQRLGDTTQARQAWWEALLAAPTGRDAERERTISAEAILSHLVADQLAAVNEVLLRAPEPREG